MKQVTTNSKIANLGEVLEGEKVDITFTFEQIPLSAMLLRLSPGCGCTSAFHADGRVYAKFEVGEIPHHIRKAHSKQPFSKSIKMELTDGTHDMLYIKGTRIKR